MYTSISQAVSRSQHPGSAPQGRTWLAWVSEYECSVCSVHACPQPELWALWQYDSGIRSCSIWILVPKVVLNSYGLPVVSSESDHDVAWQESWQGMRQQALKTQQTILEKQRYKYKIAYDIVFDIVYDMVYHVIIRHRIRYIVYRTSFCIKNQVTPLNAHYIRYSTSGRSISYTISYKTTYAIV